MKGTLLLGELHWHSTTRAAGLWASAPDTDVSLKLGEAVALSVLHDRAQTYNEKFAVHLTKFDGRLPRSLTNKRYGRAIRSNGLPRFFLSTSSLGERWPSRC